MKTIIECNCLDQNLIIKNKPTIASGGANEDVIIFNFCDKWKDLKKTAIFFNTKNDIYKQELDAENKCFIPEMTLAKAGKLYIGVYGEKECERRTSSIVSLDIQQGATVSGENLIDKAKKEQREADRSELAGVVTELTGNDFTAAEWDRLMGVTAELPIKTEQDIVDLTSYSELTNAFRQATTAPSLITGGYNLDKDENEDDILIKLPYLYTLNAKYSEGTPISLAVVECGFDVSASGDTLCHYNEVSMFNRTNSARKLQKLKLTGFECVKYGTAMFMGLPELTELELIEGDNYPESYNSNYYNQFFRNCKKLEAILGTPLDMSRGTEYGGMFQNCESLRYVRFKPGTICRDLDLSYCPALIKKYEATTDDPGTLLSIINGVREYTGAEDPITIKFSTFVKSYLSSWRCTIDEQTGLYVYSDRNSDNTIWTILTTAKGVVIS